MSLGEEDHRGEVLFSSRHLKATYYQHDSMTVDIDLDLLAEVEFVRFSPL